MDVKRINDKVSVSPQISPDDIPALRALGFTTIVNNRPDGEAPGQASSAEMQAAAEKAGMSYHFIPLGRDGVADDHRLEPYGNVRRRSSDDHAELHRLCRRRRRDRSDDATNLLDDVHSRFADRHVPDEV